MTRNAQGATGLEHIFAAISTGVDEAGSERALLFLARLVLLLSTELQDHERVLALISGAGLKRG